MSFFDVNARVVYASRACGIGHSGLQTFSSLMNMPKPMASTSYDKLVNIIVPSVKKVAEETMSDAVSELRNDLTPDEVLDTSISMDGSWQRNDMGPCPQNPILFIEN